MASALAPAFLLVAVTGAMKLAGVEAELAESDLSIPAGIVIDPDSPDVDQTVIEVLAANDLPTHFESLRVTPDLITTRPTSRSFVRLRNTDGEWGATLNQPDLQYSLMELHKGHGPAWFKLYQIIAGIALFLVITGGLAVGLMAKPYRRKTAGAFIFGTAIFAALAWLV
ncbi:hypothetical protein [Pontixanthobacter aquaemixtae]|nr:hypothetical protein [Pontixanthobacter aquaemixtae]